MSTLIENQWGWENSVNNLPQEQDPSLRACWKPPPRAARKKFVSKRLVTRFDSTAKTQ